MFLLTLENGKEESEYKSVQMTLKKKLLASSGQILRESFTADYIAENLGIPKEKVVKYFSRLEEEGHLKRDNGKLLF
jgi:Fic family protein